MPLAGDASFRRYFRVIGEGRTAVLMDAPPPHEDPRPFVAVAEWLSSTGLSAPEILARDLDRGLLLLDDFGDARLREMLDEEPARERELYALATDVLVHLHQQPPMADLPVHGLDQWLDELSCSPTGIARRLDLRSMPTRYRAAWREVLEPVAADGLGPVTVLRDYHAENIMLVAGREGVAHFGLLDFQDALCRPSGLRPRLGARRRAPRRAAGDRAGDDRPLRRGDRARGGVRARLLGARGAAQHAHPRRLHAAVEARRQAALLAVPAAHVGSARARPRRRRAGAGARLVRRQCRARSSAARPGRTRRDRGPPRASASRRGSGRGADIPRWSWRRASASGCAR